MLKNLHYYYRLLMYKLSLEGEDSDTTYEGNMPFHSGFNKGYFNINDVPEGYPEITNVKLTRRQQRLKEKELEELATLKQSAKSERQQLHQEFREKQKAITQKKAAKRSKKREKKWFSGLYFLRKKTTS